MSLIEQQAKADKVYVDHHLPLKYFLHAQRLQETMKVFPRRDARSELLGALLRDNEDEKRTPVSG